MSRNQVQNATSGHAHHAAIVRIFAAIMTHALFALFLIIGAGAARPADTYPRQSVDVEHYRFALTLADSTDRIVGVATIRIKLLSPEFKSVTLDLADASVSRQGRGMRVSSVTRKGVALVFAHSADKLSITLDHPFTTGEVLELEVRYSGIPGDGLQIMPN